MAAVEETRVMGSLEIVGMPQPGLGNQSYLLGIDGQAAVIDPARDPRGYLDAARARRWRVRWSVETHVHADFVSGSRELAALGADVWVPAAAGVAFDAEGLVGGDERDLGGLTLQALATPGHTPEHLSYVLLDGDEPLAVFSGGALIAGGVARPDLISAEHTEPLARAAWRSITRRLLTLPDATTLYPTHGPGSFCAAGPGAQHVSTIGEQRATNPLLQVDDEDAFVAQLLGSLGGFPDYFLRLRPINAAGPTVYGPTPPQPPRLTVEQVRDHAERGGELVDVRPLEGFAAGHVPGSLANPLRDQFAVWLGWLVDLDRELVLITSGEPDELDQAVRHCLSVGFERLVGHLSFADWRDSGERVATTPVLDPSNAAQSHRHVVDVRQPQEWVAGHVAGATHVELGALAHPDGQLFTDEPLLAQCGHGERAMTAASLLARYGHDVAVLAGGPDELAAARDEPLQVGR